MTTHAVELLWKPSPITRDHLTSSSTTRSTLLPTFPQNSLALWKTAIFLRLFLPAKIPLFHNPQTLQQLLDQHNEKR
jgi:hypothetical protein